MKNYKELLTEIICEKAINKSDFVSIDKIIFEEKGITVYYEYYPFSSSNETEIDNLSIYNSELNAHIFESLKQ